MDSVDTPDLSDKCLSCACQDRENETARKLLKKAEASSLIGVLAAMCMEDSAGRLVDRRESSSDRPRLVIGLDHHVCGDHLAADAE